MKNLQMMDLAVNDKRSAAAMLRGKGDGREKVWNRFEGKHEALMSQEELQATFTKAARYGKVGGREKMINSFKKMMLIAFGVLVIVS